VLLAQYLDRKFYNLGYIPNATQTVAFFPFIIFFSFIGVKLDVIILIRTYLKKRKIFSYIKKMSNVFVDGFFYSDSFCA